MMRIIGAAQDRNIRSAATFQPYPIVATRRWGGHLAETMPSVCLGPGPASIKWLIVHTNASLHLTSDKLLRRSALGLVY